MFTGGSADAILYDRQLRRMFDHSCCLGRRASDYDPVLIAEAHLTEWLSTLQRADTMAEDLHGFNDHSVRLVLLPAMHLSCIMNGMLICDSLEPSTC